MKDSVTAVHELKSKLFVIVKTYLPWIIPEIMLIIVASKIIIVVIVTLRNFR